jgi:putative sterol carrier protein
MASQGEILEALLDYATRCNSNAKLRRMLQAWTRLVQFRTLDSAEVFTVRIDDGEIVATELGAAGEPDLVVSASSEDLCDLLWGDLNPVQKYLDGEIVIRGSTDDVMRIDAMSSLMWAE